MSSEQLTQEVKSWLRREKKTTDWLGEQLCVKGGTVRGWFSYRPIPERYHARLRELMGEKRVPCTPMLHIAFPQELMRAIREEASHEQIGLLMGNFLSFVLQKANTEAYRVAHQQKYYEDDEMEDGLEAAEYE